MSIEGNYCSCGRKLPGWRGFGQIGPQVALGHWHTCGCGLIHEIKWVEAAVMPDSEALGVHAEERH